MSWNLWLVSYLVLVGLLGSYALLRTAMALSKSKRERAARVEKRRRFDAIATKESLGRSTKEARGEALERIEAQASVVRRVLLPLLMALVAMLMALPFLERAPAQLVTVAVAGFTIVAGVAARPFLENSVAGLALSYSRILNIGDTIKINGHYGSVEDISATHTTIKVWDWRRYVVPNSEMLRRDFINYSLHDKYTWAYIEFWVSYDADLDLVRDIALAVPQDSKHFAAQYEAPRFWVMSTERDAVRCWIAAWADSPADGWMLTHDMRTRLVAELKKHGIATHRHRHGFEPPVPVAASAA